MKLIFLDIDGVMTSSSLIMEKGKIYPFSESSVIALNNILYSNNVRIILTSSWRTVFNVEKQCQIFEENGICQMPMGATIDLGFENRSLEIKDYLASHDVENFVILDDMEIENFENHFLRINPENGLTMKNVKEINEILTIQWKKDWELRLSKKKLSD